MRPNYLSHSCITTPPYQTHYSIQPKFTKHLLFAWFCATCWNYIDIKEKHWWWTPVTPVLGRLRWKDHKFQASMSYMALQGSLVSCLETKNMVLTLLVYWSEYDLVDKLEHTQLPLQSTRFSLLYQGFSTWRY
jgi:hypothetical protein